MPKCSDCGGSGKYQPLIGPPENCTKCGGSGNDTGINVGPIDAQWLNLTLSTKNHAGVQVGQWYVWGRDYNKPIQIWDEVDVRFDDFRLLAVDTRHCQGMPHDEQQKQMKMIFQDDRPDEFSLLQKIEADNRINHVFPPTIFVGPRIQFFIPDGHHVAFNHVYTATSRKAFCGDMHGPGPMMRGIRGQKWRLGSTQVSTPKYSWYAPTVKELP